MKHLKKQLFIILLVVFCIPMLWLPVQAEENTNPEHVHSFKKGPHYKLISDTHWVACFTCSDSCGFSETVDCDVTVESIPATCTATGYTYHNLSVEYSGEIYTARIQYSHSPLGHNYRNGPCSRCGEKDYAPLKMPSSKSYTYTGEPFAVTAKNAEELTGEIIYKYYTDYNRTVETTPENSGASENGGAPVFVGKYYVKATYLEDETYKETNNKNCTLSIKPEPVKSLKVSNHSEGVMITWSHCPDAHMYTIYRRTETGSYQQIGTIEDPDITSCIDISAKNTKYYYNIAVHQKGSNGISVKSNRRTSGRLVYHSKLTVTNVSNGAKLKWNKVADASGYYIYRKTKGQSKYYKVKTIKKHSTLSWTDTSSKSISNGRRTYYYIKPYFKKTTSGVTKTATITNYFLSRPTAWQSGRTLDWSTNKYATGYVVEEYNDIWGADTTTKKSSIYQKFWPKKATLNTARVKAYKDVNGVRYYSAWSKKVRDNRLPSALR